MTYKYRISMDDSTIFRVVVLLGASISLQDFKGAITEHR
jgi:hypothetical protein